MMYSSFKYCILDMNMLKVGFQNGLRSKYDSLYVLLVASVVLRLQIGI